MEKSLLHEIDIKLNIIKNARDEIDEVTKKNMSIINQSLEEIVYKIRLKAAEMESSGFKPSFIFDLPDHLRITIRTLMDLGEGTAEDISNITGRSRSLESSYLNQLTTMDHVEKKRRGQLVYYKIKF